MARRTKRRGRKNRKRHEARVGFPSPLAAVLVSFAVLSLVYLWLCGRCDALGKSLTRLEDRKEDLHGRMLNEEYKWSNMKSPRRMEELLLRHHLIMSLPAEGRIIRVRPSKGGQELAPAAGTQQFAQGGDGVYMND